MRASDFHRLSLIPTLIVFLGPVGCEQPNQFVPPPPPEVTVAQPLEREVVNYAEYTGTTEALKTVEIRARVNGYLQRIAFEDGAVVEEGDLLFQIDPRPFQAALDAAEANLQKARSALQLEQAELARAEDLARRSAITEQQLDVQRAELARAEAEVSAAGAQIRQARLDLGYAEVRAPFTGRVGRHLVDVGNLVQAEQTVLARLEAFSPIYVYFYASERDVLRLRQHGRREPSAANGRPVLFLGVAGEDGFPHEGRLDFTDPRVDSSTGRVLYRGVFPNAEETLLPGMFARIRAPIGEPEPRLLVEARAIATDQRGDYLLVVAEGSTVEYRPAVLGIRTDGLRVVEEGIEPGEWVIVNGLQRARPGAKVKPQRAEMQTPAEAGPDVEPRDTGVESAASEPDDRAD